MEGQLGRTLRLDQETATLRVRDSGARLGQAQQRKCREPAQLPLRLPVEARVQLLGDVVVERLREPVLTPEVLAGKCGEADHRGPTVRQLEQPAVPVTAEDA